jgi:hypothetical protein
MNRIFQNRRYKPFLAVLCAAGWSLAYPLIKMGYSRFSIDSDDLGGKLSFSVEMGAGEAKQVRIFRA